MTRHKRTKIILKAVFGLLIAVLAVLFVAASVMAHVYDITDRNDDAQLFLALSAIQSS